ncbi:MAG: glycosyltransferase involved in cell wall biosynthesis [Myxococcota bacterium]|jgi:glycosyltransferase involved in cell wall biosynthesis
MTVSVVIAAHDEAPTIQDVVHRARAAVGRGCEVIVVDDGSSDDTAREAEAAGARVISLWPNGGKGAALRTGISESTGDWLVFIDADGQDDPAEIPLLLEHAWGDTVMVNGSRFIGTMRSGAISGPNWFGNVFMTGMLDLVFLAGITDSQAGFRAIRGDVARAMDLRSTEYEIETEMLAKVLKSGGRVVEVPVTRDKRAAGTTDFRRIRNGLRILGTILRERIA